MCVILRYALLPPHLEELWPPLHPRRRPRAPCISAKLTPSERDAAPSRSRAKKSWTSACHARRRKWDLSSGELLATLQAHADYADCPGRDRLATGSPENLTPPPLRCRHSSRGAGGGGGRRKPGCRNLGRGAGISSGETLWSDVVGYHGQRRSKLDYLRRVV